MTKADEASLPPGWAATTLGEMGVYHNGRAFKPSEWQESGRPIIRIQDLTGTGSAPHYFDGAVDPRHEVVAGDLLISWAATLGAYIWHGPPAVLNQHTFKVQSFVDRRFHYYAAQAVIADLYRISHGSGMVHVTKGKFEATPIPLPPPAEQVRIGEALDTQFARLDAAVALLERVRVGLQRYRAAVLQAAVDGRLLPGRRSGWTSSLIGDLGEVSGGLTKNPQRQRESLRLPYLRVANVHANQLQLDDMEEIGLRHEELPRVQLRRDDLLIVEGNGSLDQIGRVALWNGRIDPCVHQNHIIKARFPSPTLARWVLLWMLSPPGRADIERAASSTSGLHTLSLSKVRALRIPLPPEEQFGPIVETVERLHTECDHVERELAASAERISRLRQSLLRMAFEGRLVPQDPREDPASVLLDRIRAGRAATPPTRKRTSPRSSR